VRFDDLWLRYGRRAPWVLRQVTVDLPPGRAAVVVGRNGAGKTTLLAAAAGLLPPARGAVLDRPTRVGWVPERFPAQQPFTLRGYLVRMARTAGLRPAAARTAVETWADRLFLGPHLHTPLAEVSKGTAQKVGLAQALLVPPELLVLDEPWEGLDAQTREQVPAIVAEVLGSGGSVLVSDHLGEVARLPGALRWRVADSTVTPVDAGGDARWVIEVAVDAADAPAAVARLRAAGHDIVGVREA
jgi:ABC-2 type transport system ATP-binding protein